MSIGVGLLLLGVPMDLSPTRHLGGSYSSSIGCTVPNKETKEVKVEKPRKKRKPSCGQFTDDECDLLFISVFAAIAIAFVTMYAMGIK